MLIQIYMIILKLRSSEASSASNINLKCQFSRWKKMPLEEETHPILEFVSKQSTFDLVTWSVHRINQIYEYNLVWVMDIWRLIQSYFVQLFNVTQGLPWNHLILRDLMFMTTYFEATIQTLTLEYKTCWWHYSRQCLLVKTTTNNIYIVQLQMFSTECDYAIILFINLVSQVTGAVHYGYGSNRVVIALLSWCQ